MTTTIVTRIGKGSALTWLEADTNFTNLKATADLALELATTTFTSGSVGVAPASGGGTSNYLRADGTWAVPAGSGGPVEIQDEGTTLTSAVSSINFTGSGVTATVTGSDVTVTISSSGSTYDFAGDSTLYGPWRIAVASSTNGQFDSVGIQVTTAGVASGPAPTTTTIFTSTWRRYAENQGSGNRSTSGLITNPDNQALFMSTRGFLVSYLFGFGDSPLGSYYSTDQAMMAGMVGTLTVGPPYNTSASYWTENNLSSILGFGWDYASTTLVGVTKIGTGTATTYTISGVTRTTDHIYRGYIYKDLGDNPVTIAVQRLSNTNGAVVESGSTSIPYSELPTAMLCPAIICAGYNTAENHKASIASMSIVSRGV